MSQHALLQIIMVLLVLAAVPGVLFPVLYFFRSPWRGHPVGRVMMAVSSALGVVFTLSLLFNFVPSFPGKLWLGLGAYIYLNIALWCQLIVLIRLQGRDRRHGNLPSRRHGDTASAPLPVEDLGRC